MVVASIGSLKVAVIVVFVAIPVAPFVGVTPVTVGGVVSTGGAAVVNVQLKSAVMALPTTSFAPLLPPLTLAVYVALLAKAPLGVNVTVRVVAL
jgi:hypothetical protein